MISASRYGRDDAKYGKCADSSGNDTKTLHLVQLGEGLKRSPSNTEGGSHCAIGGMELES